MTLKPLHTIYTLLLTTAAAIALASCNDQKSYAEYLNDENKSVNSFLANNRVIAYEQRDSTFQFEYGDDAPYYELDEEGNVYMQVINPGTPGNRAATDQQIYFRFIRYNLNSYTNNTLPAGEGNGIDLTNGSTSFRYNNMQASSSYQWGEGIQMPLIYLPIDCEVNLVVKSQYGLYNEISYVVPYLYNLRYFKSQI